MSKSLGRRDFLLDARDSTGKPVIAIRCTMTVYERRDGSRYIIQDGKRVTLTVEADGSLSLKTTARMPI